MDKKKIVFVVVLLILLVAVFYPKERVIGGLRGFIAMNQVFYREEYDCLGIPYDFCPPCFDCGCDHMCYGLVYNRRCYNETASMTGNKKIETACREIQHSPLVPTEAPGTLVE